MKPAPAHSLRLRPLLVGLCLLPALPAGSAEDWIRLPLADDNVAYFIDAGSLERKNNRVRFRERISFATPDQRDDASGKFIKEKRIVRLMDCASRTQGMLEGSLISDQGRMIESVATPESQVAMSAVPAGSLAAWELDFVCKLTTGEGQNMELPPPPATPTGALSDTAAAPAMAPAVVRPAAAPLAGPGSASKPAAIPKPPVGGASKAPVGKAASPASGREKANAAEGATKPKAAQHRRP